VYALDKQVPHCYLAMGHLAQNSLFDAPTRV